MTIVEVSGKSIYVALIKADHAPWRLKSVDCSATATGRLTNWQIQPSGALSPSAIGLRDVSLGADMARMLLSNLVTIHQHCPTAEACLV